MHKKLLEYLVFSLVRVLMFLMQYLPESFAEFTAMRVIGVLKLLMPRIRSVGLRNLELVFPEKTLEERKRILEKSFRILARNLLTFARFPNYSKEQFEEMFDLKELNQLVRDLERKNPDTGIIGTAMHCGCFELFPQAYAISYGGTSSLARGFGIKQMDSWWDKRRSLYGNQIFGRKGGYKEVIRRVKNKEVVFMLVDQNVKKNHAVFVDLFRIPAATTKTAAISALRTGAPLIFAVSVEPERGKHKVYFSEIEVPTDSEMSTSEKITLINRRIHLQMEKVIRNHPEQWFWIHRRFKTRPEGEPENLYIDK